jgi:hypothetical protein
MSAEGVARFLVEKEPMTVHYKGGKAAERKIRKVLSQLGITVENHYTRKDELEGETDPYYRKHVKAKFFIEALTDEEANALSDALDKSRVNWSFWH